LLRQVHRGLSPTDVIDVIHDVVAGENDFGTKIPQGDVQDQAPRWAVAQLADVWRDRRRGERSHWAVTQRGPDVLGDLHVDPVERPLALPAEPLCTTWVPVKEDERFEIGEYRQEKARDLEIDQTAPDHPHAPHFAAVQQALSGQSRARR